MKNNLILVDENGIPLGRRSHIDTDMIERNVEIKNAFELEKRKGGKKDIEIYKRLAVKYNLSVDRIRYVVKNTSY